MNPLQPTPPTVGHLTSIIRGYGQLGTYVAEALDTLNNLAISDRIAEAQASSGGSSSILPIIITDPTGDVVAILGYASDGSLANYGLSTYDLTGNQVALVGIQLEIPLAITAATNASPTVVTVPGNTYANNNTIRIAGEPGNTAINGERMLIDAGVAGAGTFHITDLSGNLINGNGAFTGPATSQRYFAGVYVVTGNTRIAMDNQQRAGGPTGTGVTGGIGVEDIAHGAQTTIGAAFIVLVNKNGKPCMSTAVLDPTNPASAGVLRVFDGSGTGQFASGEVFFYDGNTLNGQCRGQFTAQIVGGGTYARLAEIGDVSGVDSNGAWAVSSLNGLQLRGAQVIAGNADAFLRTISIGAFGLVFNTTADANVNSLTIASSSFLISHTGDANLNSIAIGGVPGVSRSGGFEITGFSTTTLTAGSDAGTVVVTGITTRAQTFTGGIRSL